jgi:hypothetical protein
MKDVFSNEMITVISNEFNVDYNSFSLFINENSHLVIRKDGEDFIGSKILNINDNRFAHIIVVKNNDSITIYLNGEKIFEIQDSKIIHLIEEIELKIHYLEKQIIREDLSEWVEKRKATFKIKIDTSDKYEIIPIKEQEKQLDKAVTSLEKLIALSISDEGLYIEHILSSLRALLFFKEKSSNYDPLLLRLAAYKEIVLPIWVNPYFSEINDTTLLSISCPASINITGSNFKMIDFQEYLESNIIQSSGELLTPLQFIESSSTSRSTAHFDQRVPKTITNIDKVPILNNINSFNRIVLDLASLTVSVAKMILK